MFINVMNNSKTKCLFYPPSTLENKLNFGDHDSISKNKLSSIEEISNLIKHFAITAVDPQSIMK